MAVQTPAGPAPTTAAVGAASACTEQRSNATVGIGGIDLARERARGARARAARERARREDPQIVGDLDHIRT